MQAQESLSSALPMDDWMKVLACHCYKDIDRMEQRSSSVDQVAIEEAADIDCNDLMLADQTNYHGLNHQTYAAGDVRPMDRAESGSYWDTNRCCNCIPGRLDADTAIPDVATENSAIEVFVRVMASCNPMLR